MPSLVERFTSHPFTAIDLGTANTRLYACGQETFAEKPSLVQHVKAGNNDRPDEYLTCLNAGLVSAPLRGGVVVDVKNAISLLRPMLRRPRGWLRQPVALACAPTDTSDKERKRLTQAILGAGAARVAIIPEPWAAAVGAGIDVNRPAAQLLIDIGEGVTDLAVIREGRLVYTSAVRTACHDLQQAIKNAVRSRHRVNLSRPDLERLTHEIDSGLDHQESETSRPGLLTLNGIDIIRHRPVEISVSRAEIVEAMEPVLAKILRMVEIGIRRVPPRFAAEVRESGICLTGGGSCIKGIAGLIAARTHLAVEVTPEPKHTVIKGAIQILLGWKEKGAWRNSLTWPAMPS